MTGVSGIPEASYKRFEVALFRTVALRFFVARKRLAKRLEGDRYVHFVLVDILQCGGLLGCRRDIDDWSHGCPRKRLDNRLKVPPRRVRFMHVIGAKEGCGGRVDLKDVFLVRDALNGRERHDVRLDLYAAAAGARGHGVRDLKKAAMQKLDARNHGITELPTKGFGLGQ